MPCFKKSYSVPFYSYCAFELFYSAFTNINRFRTVCNYLNYMNTVSQWNLAMTENLLAGAIDILENILNQINTPQIYQ